MLILLFAAILVNLTGKLRFDLMTGVIVLLSMVVGN